jgi:hypothetical protein
MIEDVNWPYKVNQVQLHLRDQAIIAFTILVGIRASEFGGLPERKGKTRTGKIRVLPATQPLRKKQTRVYQTHILIVNVQPLKHGDLRDEIILPKSGVFAPFTAIIEEWLQQVPDEESVLFPSAIKATGKLNWEQPLRRSRIQWIIKSQTGMFPHWFRGICESVYGRIFFKNDAWALKKFMGLKNLESTSPYVEGQWKTYEKNIFKEKL